MVIENLDVVRRGLMSLPLTHPHAIASVRTFADVSEIDLTTRPPHVVVLDYWLRRDNQPSLEYVPTLQKWGAHVLLYTTEEAPHPLQRAMQAGVDGLCLKNDGVDALVAAIVSLGHGEAVLSSPLARALISDGALRAKLTPAEVETLRALAYGKTPAEIAKARFLAVSTIETHVEHIRAKYAASTGGKVNRARMLHEGLKDGYLGRMTEGQDPEIT